MSYFLSNDILTLKNTGCMLKIVFNLPQDIEILYTLCEFITKNTKIELFT